MCQQLDNQPLDYRCINISVDNMQKIVREITQKTYLPYFTEPVLCDSELVSTLHDLHQMLMQQEKGFKKDELFLLIMEELILEHADTIFEQNSIEPSAEIKTICTFLQTNYSENIKLSDLSQLANMSKYHLLRSFTKQKGISPYCYLEAIRISAAKKLLEQQCSPLNVALQTGFSDQSHFSNFFKRIIGLTPKQYMNIFITETKHKK
jgi:AraC-like DNA-binding protein